MRSLLIGAVLAFAAPAGAATIVLDFEQEPLAVYENTSFTSAECGCVDFAEQDGGWLFVEENALGSRVLIPGEEGGRLVLQFLVPVTAVALDFGNDTDDAEFIGDAVLEGLVGGTVVASATVTPNGNNLTDQTIAISFTSPLTSARFRLPQSGEFEPISPYVDNIVLTVPEPAALALAALAVLRVRCRSQRVGGHPRASSR
jgi:hypothetical protein